MASTFGVFIPGRPIDTNFQQVDVNKFLINIPVSDKIDYLGVFLTNIIPLPDQTAACIFFSPPGQEVANWSYLGHLTNIKPSAMFKITNLKPQTVHAGCSSDSLGFTSATNDSVTSQIGISVEPINSVLQMVPAIETKTSNVSSFVEFIQKTVTNLFNYCQSYGRPAGQLQDGSHAPSELFMPLSALQSWYQTYSRRLEKDPNFWKALN